MELNNNDDDLINYYNFNEDGSCITIGTKNGFKIITTNPFTNYHKRIIGRGIGIIEMYHSSNILALTGNDKNSKFPSNKLIIWDDNKEEIIKEIIMSYKIRIVKIIKNFLFIVNDIKAYILNFENLLLIESFEIFSSEKELISFSVNEETKIAYIDSDYKTIHIKKLGSDKKNKIKIQDEELKLVYITFNFKGDILAAATLGKIYLYKCSNKEIIREINNDNLKNGNINCISFSENNKYLGVSVTENNSGRINIFDIGTPKESNFLSFFINEEDKCFSYFKITKSKEFIFRFDKDEIILIITSSGEYIKIKIDKINGGYCKKIQNNNIFN